MKSSPRELCVDRRVQGSTHSNGFMCWLEPFQFSPDSSRMVVDGEFGPVLRLVKTCSASYRLASLPGSWWTYFYRTRFHPFLRRTLSKWVQESFSNCSAVLASCPRTNKQRWHPPHWRVSPGSSLRKPMHTIHTMDSWWWRKDTYHTPGTVLSILLWSAHWVFITMLPARNYYYLHFRDDETEVPGS